VGSSFWEKMTTGFGLIDWSGWPRVCLFICLGRSWDVQGEI